MMATSSPALQTSAYEWILRQSPGNYTESQNSNVTCSRRALAGEQMWIHRKLEYHQIFLGGSFTYHHRNQLPTANKNLISASKQAWRLLRFQVPELVLRSSYDKNGVGFLEYRVPPDEDEEGEIDEWIKSTHFISNLPACEPSFECLRDEISSRKNENENEHGYQAFMLLDFGEEGIVRFILNVHHLITDGIGIRILLGWYFEILVRVLDEDEDGRGSRKDLVWEESVRNLSKPWIAIMNEDQVLSGERYERGVEWNREVLGVQMNWGLPLKKTSSSTPNPNEKKQNHHSLTLSKGETQSLLRSIKTSIGPESNITHLGHTAMVLAMLRANPLPQSGPSSLYSPCWLNGRRYLQPSLFPDTGTASGYFPICQSFAPIIFADLASLVTTKRDTEEGDLKALLVDTCKIVTREYGKIRERKSILPESVVLLESFGGNMFRRKQEQYTVDAVDSRPEIADPFFLSDGITERYISHSYTHGKATLTINDDLTFAANAEGPNLIVRMSSWRGRLSISAEWRGVDYERSFVEDFLKNIKGMLFLLA